MANSIITAAGLALFARALDEGLTVPIDRMIFADIPGLNTDAEPDSAQRLPENNIVFNAEIQTSGKIDEQTVVYSKVLSATDGDFFINWIGLYSTQYNTLVAVCQVPRHRKYKTTGFQAGNTLYKNFALQFANAAQLTGITIPPQTWQYDFDNRYALKQHNHEIGQVNGLQEALNGKAESGHNHDGRYDGAGTAANAVNAHNGAADPHPGKFAAASHGHEIGQVNGLQEALNGKAESGHNHDGRYDSAGTAANAVNAHNGAADPHPGKFAAASHGHEIGQVNGLQGALDGKAAASHGHEIGQVNGLQEALNGKAESGHNHDGRYDSAGTAANAVNAHNGAVDPHPGKFLPVNTDIQEKALNRVWVSGPVEVTGKTRIVLDHNLGLNPQYARADVLLRCKVATDGYEVGEFAENLFNVNGTGGIQFFLALRPALTDNQISMTAREYWMYGDKTSPGTSAACALTKNYWELFFRIFY